MKQEKTLLQKIKWLWSIPVGIAGMFIPCVLVTFIPALFDSDWSILLFLLFPATAIGAAWMGVRFGGRWWAVWIAPPAAFALAAVLIFRETLVLPVLLPALVLAALAIGTAFLTERALRKKQALPVSAVPPKKNSEKSK